MTPSVLSTEKRFHRGTIPSGRPEVTPEARRPPRKVPTRCLPTRGSCGPCVARASPPRPSRRSCARGTTSAPPRGRPSPRRRRRASAWTKRPRRREAATFRQMRNERLAVRRERAAKKKKNGARCRRLFWRKVLLQTRRGDESGGADADRDRDRDPDPAALLGARSRLLVTRCSGRNARRGWRTGGPRSPPPRTRRLPTRPTSSPRRRLGTRAARRRPRSS